MARATLNVTDNAVVFYTKSTAFAAAWADTNANGGWVQLGDPQIESGSTSIGADSAPLHIGNGLHGRIYAVQIRDGLDGAPAFDMDVTEVSSGTTAFHDHTEKIVVLTGGHRVLAPPGQDGLLRFVFSQDDIFSCYMRILRIRGAHTTDWFEAVSGVSEFDGTEGGVTAPSVTLSRNNCLVVAAFTVMTGPSGAITGEPIDMSSRWGEKYPQDDDFIFSRGYSMPRNSGATSGRTLAMSGDGGFPRAAHQMAIAPVDGGKAPSPMTTSHAFFSNTASATPTASLAVPVPNDIQIGDLLLFQGFTVGAGGNSLVMPDGLSYDGDHSAYTNHHRVSSSESGDSIGSYIGTHQVFDCERGLGLPRLVWQCPFPAIPQMP